MAILSLQPIYQERIWGGRTLETELGRALPADQVIGEAWELCDRPEAQTHFKESGQSIHEVWTGAGKTAVFGTAAPATERFPILVKILDAVDKLSLQVHPPAKLAPQFNGEPKTECWYFLDTQPDAEIYVGLKKGVSPASFREAVENKRVAECFHRLKTQRGDFMFLPSGRVHAIGAGNLILEVQQNSDTTFRVYDWDRIDAKTGQGRELHLEESLQSINFHDFEPQFAQPHGQKLLRCDLFHMNRFHLFEKDLMDWRTNRKTFQLIFVSFGEIKIGEQTYGRGSSLFVEAETDDFEIQGLTDEVELIEVAFPVY